jgi:hypothetical protein
MTFLYVGIIVSEGNNPWIPVTLIALVMAVASAAALAAATISDAEKGRRLLGGSAFLFALVGMMAILTIGMPFLVAAGLAATGASRLGDRPTGAETTQP